MAEARAVIEGWLFDVYPGPDGMVLWVLDGEGRPRRLVAPYQPGLYIAGSLRAVEAASRALQPLSVPITIRPAVQRELMSGAEVAVFRVSVGSPLAFPAAARRLTRLPGLTLYNGDIPTSRLFFYETGLFPLARCRIEVAGGVARRLDPLTRPEDLEYDLPPLVTLRLRLVPATGGEATSSPAHGRRGPLEAGVDGETVIIDGDDPAECVRSLNRLLARYDPDVLLTEWGDAFLLPRLRALANCAGIPLHLNRDPHGAVRTRRARSYVTYGQVVYQAGAQMLAGRWHIDLRNSFIYTESEMAGLLEIARLSRIPVQDQARTSPGTAISSMQIQQAVRDGILIPWQKSEPEGFKTASQLLLTDKGGLTYQPLVGVYEQVGELDFSSMYPTMMARFNISPETVGCACCPDSRIPEIHTTVCRRRRGLVPRVLDHLLERRMYYRRRKHETVGAERELYNQRQTALKWCLVTCLDGATLVPVRRAGRIEVTPIREVVDPYLPAGPGVLPVHDLHVFGYDERLQPLENPVRCVIKVPALSTLFRVELQTGRELRMIGSHRCFVVEEDRLVARRADELREGDLIPVASPRPQERPPAGTIDGGRPRRAGAYGPFLCLPVRSIDRVDPSSPYVYCFEVQRGLRGFLVAGGIFTANSFGYLGYRNARFGRIEAHEAVTAFAREMLLRAKAVAEGRGYRMLHALVDSMWLHRPGAARGDYEILAREITQATGLPIFVEGVYRWLGFLPSRTHKGVGVPNRYMGVFEDGSTKVRGIEVRRSDVPPLVERTQARMLQRMFACRTLAEVRAALPEVLGILEEALVRLRAGEVTPEELVVTTHLSQEVAAYRHNTVQAIAARTLARHGARVHPGEAVQYIITDRTATAPEDRARPYTLLGGDWSYDADAYAAMLVRAGATVLDLLGYSDARLWAELWERSPATPASRPARGRCGRTAPGSGC